MLSGCDDRGGSSRSGCSIFDGAPGLPTANTIDAGYQKSRGRLVASYLYTPRNEGHTPRSYGFDTIAAWHCTTQPQWHCIEANNSPHFLRARSRGKLAVLLHWQRFFNFFGKGPQVDARKEPLELLGPITFNTWHCSIRPGVLARCDMQMCSSFIRTSLLLDYACV